MKLETKLVPTISHSISTQENCIYPIFPLLLESHFLEWVDMYKYLGVSLSHDLALGEHAQSNCSKIRGLLYKRFYYIATPLLQLCISLAVGNQVTDDTQAPINTHMCSTHHFMGFRFASMDKKQSLLAVVYHLSAVKTEQVSRLQIGGPLLESVQCCIQDCACIYRYIKAWLNLFLTTMCVIFVMLYLCT